jgi:hypothetical protein
MTKENDFKLIREALMDFRESNCDYAMLAIEALDRLETPTDLYLNYRCHMRTIPGMYEQHSGHVDVIVNTPSREAIFTAAIKALSRTFPHYSSLMWEMVSFESL